MGLVIKGFDWQEDLDNFDFCKWMSSSGISGRHVANMRLTWKGKFRKLFGIKKCKERIK